MVKIKKKYNNEYTLTPTNIWVRNYEKNITPYNLNQLYNENESKAFIENEISLIQNKAIQFNINSLPFGKKILIVSDGYNWVDLKGVLPDIPNDVIIIGVNGSLKSWPMRDDQRPVKKMDYYLISHPFDNAVKYLPKHLYRPRCLTSVRTNKNFSSKYKGDLLFYHFSPNGQVGRKIKPLFYLDDYLNPICDVLQLALKRRATHIGFLGCDDAFEGKKETAICLEGNIWSYPQHKIVNDIINHLVQWTGEIDGYNPKLFSCSKWFDYSMVKKSTLQDFATNFVVPVLS